MTLRSFLSHSVEEPDVYRHNRPYFILMGDGVYRHIHTGAYLRKDKYIDFGEKMVPGLAAGTEGVEYALPKIPFKLWLMILDFYKEVNDKYGTEASAHIFHGGGMTKEDVESEFLKDGHDVEPHKNGLYVYGDWVVYCPIQRNTKTFTSFAGDKMYDWMRENLTPVVETHSHNTMNAFWSGTDDENQQDAHYYGVYGRLGTSDVFILKYVIDGKVTNIPVTDVFEFPTVETTVRTPEGYEDAVTQITVEERPCTGRFKRKDEFPDEWMLMIEEKPEYIIQLVDKGGE